MPERSLHFHTLNARRTILLVEDEVSNRELLLAMFADEYEVLAAETGAQALELLYQNSGRIDVVLLDLMLPDLNGLDILRQIKGDPQLAGIPVIVMTADSEAEVESLHIGAMDFIPKPYPLPKVVQARVRRTIEFTEDRDIIRLTERDELTGLYNKEYFYNYAEQMDNYHRAQPMDALVVNINHFRMINERYGKAYGDDVLRRMGGKLREIIGTDGIVCRRDGDVFLIYCHHLTNYSDILDRASDGMDSRIRMRIGVYPLVDKGIDMERRFDRAKMAADTIRNSFTKTIAIYDSALHESELFAEQLLEDFQTALAEKQFLVYYQPKFNIQPEEPILSSSEALVRWKHPTLGMISPGVFIPLFESNGLIQQLDRYVWREAAAQMRDWKERLGFVVPVSVNVSRVDLFDPDLLHNLRSLIDEYGLKPAEFLLEITESAYTEDSDHIVKTVNRLREAGFSIEMDDFGSGYSSLNMLSSLPVDALKLDMQFLRNAFRERKNTKILNVMIDIAASLDVPTVAEGVETAEQLMTIRSMGCDIAQGFYFSRPIPAAEFERFLLERRDSPVQESHRHAEHKASFADGNYAYEALHDPVTGLYNYSAYEVFMRDTDESHIALMVATVDEYELIRARYGREITDRVLERVAEVLRHAFRSVDYVCRISNDEFVVIISRINSAQKDNMAAKVEQMNATLQRPTDGLPPVSLSAGIAFGDRENPEGDIFHDADAALYHMKEMKRCGCAFA